MKAIFDSIRALFRDKPRSYRDSTPTLSHLADFERGIRGFSNRIDILTGPKALGSEDRVLQYQLRASLKGLLNALRRTPPSESEAGEFASILEQRDDTGYLCSTALDLMRNQWRNHEFSIEDQGADWTGTRLRYHFSPRRTGLAQRPAALPRIDIVLTDINLDTLSGAIDALTRLKAELAKALEAIPTSGPYLAQQAEITKTGAQEARIRAHLRMLSADDQARLRSLARAPHWLSSPF